MPYFTKNPLVQRWYQPNAWFDEIKNGLPGEKQQSTGQKLKNANFCTFKKKIPAEGPISLENPFAQRCISTQCLIWWNKKTVYQAKNNGLPAKNWKNANFGTFKKNFPAEGPISPKNPFAQRCISTQCLIWWNKKTVYQAKNNGLPAKNWFFRLFSAILKYRPFYDRKKFLLESCLLTYSWL